MRNILAEPGFEPAADGWEARTLPLCHANPQYLVKVLPAPRSWANAGFRFLFSRSNRTGLGFMIPCLAVIFGHCLASARVQIPSLQSNFHAFLFWKRTLNKTRQKGSLLCFDVFQLTNIWSNWSISHKIHFSGNRADKSWMFARL